ncbi:MAG: RNA 2',3'-cyclic phosphodiesterase [Deltaproteobacteria bacterium]|nr:RNA 2',3'-cyclic phosphodiesterase [Deltaproteobacteria bacterium]
MSETIRLFTAIEIPHSINLALKKLAGLFPDLKFLPGEKAHITLRFLGEFEKNRLPELTAALAKVQGTFFEVSFSGLGTFKMNRSLVLWAGIKDNPALTGLYDSVNESLLQELGLIKPTKAYTPHVTLSRVKSPDSKKVLIALESFAQDLGDQSHLTPGPASMVLAPAFMASEFGLYQSILHSGPAIHLLIKAFPLQKSPSPVA